MARDKDDTGRTRSSKAVPSTRQKGKRRGPGDGATGVADLQPRLTPRGLHLQDLANTLDECRRQLKSARQEIEMLGDRNSLLQQELLALAQKEAQARHLAYHDALTGLPNRSLLQDRFQQALSQAERHHRPLALLLLDLDEFKCVNDRLGHSSGDLLLQAVAERLGAVVRAADTACRYGGDEFAILLPELDHPGMVSAVTAKIRLRLGEPYIIDGYRIHMTVSVGTAVYPADGQTCDELMNRADVAMYLAKGAGHDVSIIALPDTPHLREPMPTPYAPKDMGPMPNRRSAIANKPTQGQSVQGQSVRFDGGAPPPWSAARRHFRSS